MHVHVDVDPNTVVRTRLGRGPSVAILGAEISRASPRQARGGTRGGSPGDGFIEAVLPRVFDAG